MRGVSGSADRGASEQRGEILDVLRTLLVDGRGDDVVSLVTKLVANNTELAVRAARAASSPRAPTSSLRATSS